MTYSDAIKFLYELRWFGGKLGLANTLRLAQLAGNPQHQLRFIHVAGTNGKGSTCAILESIYRAAGLRVGLFTSPHLVSFGERIQINRCNIPEREVARFVLEMRSLLQSEWGDLSRDKEHRPGVHPTFFEVVTVMALRYFAEQKCDLVIWETGLGGRLDATNIVTPLASVITNIQYDHQEWLGESLTSIAAEKAGIIKPNLPVITAIDEPAALQFIQKTARAQNAPVTVISSSDLCDPILKTMHLPLLGQHQRLNAALAIATVRTLNNEIPVTENAIVCGVNRVRWPGRLQLITRPSGQKLLLDGAHNVAGAEALAAWLKEYSFKPALVLGILQDKNWASMCRVLAPFANRICLVPVSSERAAAPEQLQQACQKRNPRAEAIVCKSLAEALEATAEESFVLVTGSLYLAGETLELLELATEHRAGERALNEWVSKV